MQAGQELTSAPAAARWQPVQVAGATTRSASRTSEAVVALENVRFAWGAGAPAQLTIDRLCVRRGERVLLRGPSGSGKSTLLGVIAGIAVPQQGRVRVLDRDISALPGSARDRFRADHVGYVFQMFNLIAYLSPIENVVLPCGFSRRRRARAVESGGSVEDEALRLLRALGLADAAVLRRPAATLSVGQQQRVAVARALIGAPELVLADEPTSALDADRRDEFLDLLFSRCDEHDTTVVLASHDATLAPRFDRVMALSDGRVAATSAGTAA